MGGKRRASGIATRTSVEDEIAHLRGLDLKGMRARWQSVFGGSAPAHLPRHLLLAIIAYRLQADRFGDLDQETRQMLDRTDAAESGSVTSARLMSFDQKRTGLTPLPRGIGVERLRVKSEPLGSSELYSLSAITRLLRSDVHETAFIDRLCRLRLCADSNAICVGYARRNTERFGQYLR